MNGYQHMYQGDRDREGESRLNRLIDGLRIRLLIAPRPCAPFGGGADSKQLRNVFRNLQLHMKMLF
jgi:hypothetical protein